MEVIDVKAAREYVMGNYPNDPLLKHIAVSLLEQLPKVEAKVVIHGSGVVPATADMVEVVRCKDCKYYHTYNRSVRFACKELYCCRSAIKKVSPEDFCSFGERKDND